MADPTVPSVALGELPPDGPTPVLAPGRVAVVLVSHDGERWLPTVLEGLAAQRVVPDHVVAVDTGSRDASRELLREHPAVDRLVELTSRESYPAAVAAGVEALAAGPAVDPTVDQAPPDWIWLLHDDSTPEEGALEQLLLAAGAPTHGGTRPPDVLGPKLREWPSLRRLLELGVTISGTGRRETGLERGEYDQGQHDVPGIDVPGSRDVLAVNTAGLLVRREAWEALDGLDEHLPIFGNDLDLGWRAAASGHRVVVVPSAVVFHAEAATRGVRRTPITGRHTHVAERRAALRTLLVNASGRSLPWRVLRLGLGTLVRMVGFLLVRAPGEALDDLAALVAVYGRPGEIRAARRARRDATRVGEDRSRELLAPAWLPYRHGLDFLGDLASAATLQAADVAERRRDERAAEVADRAATGRRNRHAAPVARVGAEVDGDDDVDPLAGAPRGPVARFLTSPLALAVTAFVVAALVVVWPAYGAVSGGALAPAPDGAGAWWTLHLASWHPIGVAGSEVPAPPYVVVMALLATLLLGSATAAVSAVLVLAVPLALWGAWRFLRVASRLADPAGAPRWLLAAGAGAWAVLPLTSGAWGQGRLGVVVLAALLPWLAHAALGFLDPEPDRRRRAGWRTGLLLTVAVAFVPTTWPLAAVLVLVVLVAGFALSPRGMRSRSAWGPLLVSLLVPVVLLAPWWVGLALAGAPGGLLLEAARGPVPAPDTLDLLTGHLGDLPDAGSPWWWLGVLPAALAVVALLAARTRAAVVACWVVALLAVVVGGLLGLLRLDLGAVVVPASTAPVVVVVAAAALTAAVLGALTLRPARVGPAVVSGVLAVAAVGGLGWAASGGQGELGAGAVDPIPAYMTQSSLLGPERGVLVVDGDLDTGLDYTVRRGDGTTVGEAEVQLLTPSESPDATDAAEVVAALLGRGDPDAVAALPGLGVEYVVLSAPADGRVAAALDAVDGLAQASAEDRSTRAWQVEAEPVPGASSGPEGPGAWLHTVLAVLGLLALLVVAVLCGPSRRNSR